MITDVDDEAIDVDDVITDVDDITTYVVDEATDGDNVDIDVELRR